jgi:hypothetical protein
MRAASAAARSEFGLPISGNDPHALNGVIYG